MNVNCDRQSSGIPRHHHHVLSTTSTPTTPSQLFTASGDVIVTSSAAAVQRPVYENDYVTSVENGDWLRRKTLERPPLVETEEHRDEVDISTRIKKTEMFLERPPLGETEEHRDDVDTSTGIKKTERTLERPPLGETEEHSDDVDTSRRTKKTESLNTIKHWLEYSEKRAGPSVYRELSDDVDEEDWNELDVDDETTMSREHHHHLHRPSDTVVHVHHVHEVHDHEVSVADAEAAKISATATETVHIDELDTRQTSSADEPRHNNKLSRAHGVLNYNIEEGLATSYFCRLKASRHSHIYCITTLVGRGEGGGVEKSIFHMLCVSLTLTQFCARLKNFMFSRAYGTSS